MTVVLEDQVKTITREISFRFGGDRRVSSAVNSEIVCGVYFADHVGIEDVVRAVIAQYDISSIPRLEAPSEDRGNDYTAPCN